MYNPLLMTNFMKRFIIFIVLTITALTSFAQTRLKIAVMDFTPGTGVTAANVSGLVDMLVNSLYDTQKFTIVERYQLNQVLREQNFQQNNLSTSQIVKVGKLLGVQAIVIGTVNFIVTDRTIEQVYTGMATGEYNIDVRIVSVETGEVIATAGVTRSGSATYRDLMPKLASQIANKISSTRSSYSSTNSSVPVLYGYLYVYPEELGCFETYPSQVINSINSSKSYGISGWRLPTYDELELLNNNAQKIGFAPLSLHAMNGYGYWYMGKYGPEKDGGWKSQRLRLVYTK